MRRFKISVDGVAYDVTVDELELEGKVAAPQPSESPGHSSAFNAVDAPKASSVVAKSPAPRAQSAAGDVVCPLAGTIIEVKVSAGQTVKSGDLLVVLEAMKMETTVAAPMDGKVQNIAVSPGQSVQEGVVLLSLTPV
ncbi:MAG: acetyl-CoA carboxylase biotin carboxyl carrier protein subunit [Gammaproteobacteria bacterium]|nr:acetyl-CoA carboxylase biotin carboxyl carrier protein subunit [Gammaproteobacteria bacterium]